MHENQVHRKFNYPAQGLKNHLFVTARHLSDLTPIKPSDKRLTFKYDYDHLSAPIKGIVNSMN